MKRYKLHVFILAVVILISALLYSGCEVKPQTAVYAQGFLDCIIKKDYKGAYERTYPYSAQTLAEKDFVQKYKDIFEGLKITRITVTEGKVEDAEEKSTYTYTAKYISEPYGELQNTFTMVLRPYEEGMRVDWSPSLIFPEMDFGDTISVATLKGERGEIISADSVPLAKNDYAQTVIVNLTKSGEFTAFSPALFEKLQLDQKAQENVKKKYDAAVKNEDDILLVQAYPKDHFDEAFIADLKTIPGVDVDDAKYTGLRFYPLREAAAHIVGYTSAPDEKKADELKKAGLDPATHIGKEGLEQTYEDKLRGADGEAVYIRDEKGVIKSTLYKKDAVNGCDLQTTINSKLQEKAFKTMASTVLPGQAGAAIVMNAKTGEIEAAVSYPAYDDNIFSFPIDQATYDEFKKDINLRPLINRLTQGLYPPGSVIKPFTGAAALEEGKITPSTTFPFEGQIKDDLWKPEREDWVYPGIKRVDNSGSSPMTLSSTLIKSDNIYYAWAAMELGQDKMVEYLNKYSLGKAIPFDLPLNPPNIVNKNTKIDIKLLADMGYGQGHLLVTPIQMASMYTVFCNNGNMLKPTLVKRLMRENGLKYDTVEEIQSTVLSQGVMKQSTLDILLPIMEKVVTEGTGHGATVKDVRIAGKTGTAQLSKTKEISWFAGFWMDEINNEKRLVLVMLEVAAGEGGVKLDIAKQLLTPDKDEDTQYTQTPSDPPAQNSTEPSKSPENSPA